MSVTDSYKISLNSRSNQLEFWGTLLLTLPLFDWPDDRLINIPEMKISLTNYCYKTATAATTVTATDTASTADAVVATAAASRCC